MLQIGNYLMNWTDCHSIRAAVAKERFLFYFANDSTFDTF